MYNIGDDNELDRISREAAGRYSPPASGSDWESLSAKLDKVMPVAEEKKRRGFFFWWLLPVLLIGGGTTYWLTSDNNTTEQPVTITQQKPPVFTQTDKKPNEITTKITEANKENTNSIQADIPTGNSSLMKEKQGLPSRKTGKTKAIPAQTNLSTFEQATNTATPNTTVSKPATQQVTVTPEVSATTQLKNQEKTTGAETKNNTVQSQQELEQPVKATKIEPAQEPNQPVTEEQKVAETKTILPVSRGKGWSYAFVAGVDKSTVKFKYGNSPGINAGMIGGYHFNDKLSIHTGAIYTQKNYKVAGEDFIAPKGSWASYYKIDNVEGYCRMWEIPLLLRYTISQSAKKNVFLSTGLSSYFMTKENYDYYYYSNSGQLVTRHNAYNSTDTHIMSIAHVSVGFENRLNRNWSVLVEPYAKIPLGGVGFGSIRLSSFGLNFSIQHRQPSKK